ncbi:hypothetical protein CHUAL_007349 [Chamberlinius hualienensis]
MADESNYGEDIISSEEEVEDDGEEDEGEDLRKSSEDEGEVDGDGDGEKMDEDVREVEDEKDDEPEDYGTECMDTMERQSSVGETPLDDPQNLSVDDVNSGRDHEEENDDDKESSYHSSPPASPPMSPVSPDAMTNAKESSTFTLSQVAKEAIEDREGELDFEEEDTVEDGKDYNEPFAEPERSSEGRNIAREEAQSIIKEEFKKSSNESADPDDEGEVEDDDDLEEGEVKDSVSSNRKLPQKPLCRFYSKGQCTWGNNCRFLHPGINDKGNYNMFSSAKPSNTSGGSNSVYTWTRPDSYYNKGYSEPAMPPPLPPPAHDEPHRESAWERGLRHAKEILKKSSKRKEMEPDFEEKRMNLTLSSGDLYNDYEKENDYYSRNSPYRRNSDRYSFEYEDPIVDPYERQAHEYWRGGNYENFEVRYMRSDYDYRDDGRGDRILETERNRMERLRERDREVYHVDRERDGRSRRDKFERQHTPERSWRDDHYSDIQSQSRSRGDEWRDPWRRSTSPKRINQSRSYSSNSSASYSSSRSSGSHTSYTTGSRSSSASSHSSYSSRSYSRDRMHAKSQVQHKPYVEHVPVPNRRGKVPPTASGQQIHHAKASRNQLEKWPSGAGSTHSVQVLNDSSPGGVIMDKKRDKTISSRAVIRGGSLSSSGSSRSSRSGSSHTSTSRSRSRSSSASSLESVSSKSSMSSKSSFVSQHKAQADGDFKRDNRHSKEKRKLHDNSVIKVMEKARDNKMNVQLQAVNKATSGASKSLSKDLLKQSGQKTQIKLTLLNKEKAAAVSAVAASNHRKESIDVKRSKVVEREPVKAVKPPIVTTAPPVSRKRPASPLHMAAESIVAKIAKTVHPMTTAAPPKNPSTSVSASSKKSTSSRREELLKQLKAVEDAIARKRAKLS